MRVKKKKSTFKLQIIITELLQFYYGKHQVLQEAVKRKPHLAPEEDLIKSR